MATLPGHLQALLPEPSELRLERVERTSNLILIVVKAARQSAACPNCRVTSHRVHSRYERMLRDLPWHGATVRLRLLARRFYCRSPDCCRKIFAERLAGVVRRHGRSTQRFRQTLALIGYALGGEAGARLAERMGIESSSDTILRTLKEDEPDSDTRAVRVLGVDDWAWRKAQRYGTILVDLERRRPVDLLADRSATSLERWLHDHPGVEVIARDRSNCYAEAATNAAPEATQVADRFHLLSNLTAAAERALEQIRIELPVDESVPVIPPEPNSAQPIPNRESQLSRQRRQRRVERYNEVMRLYKEGHSQKTISRMVGLERKTVRRFLRSGQFPERGKAKHKPGQVEQFRQYLEQRWKQGCHNATQLWREIRDRGYSGGRGMVARMVSSFRAPGTKYFRTAAAQPRSRRVSSSPHQIASLLVRRPERVSRPEQEFLTALKQNNPGIDVLHGIVQDFSTMMRERNLDRLGDWMHRATATGIPAVKSFVVGLRRDQSAVNAAFSSEWSSGQVEGQIHRLKLIKRQMYGRAGFALLRRRVLPFVADEERRAP
jgi:transposase